MWFQILSSSNLYKLQYHSKWIQIVSASFFLPPPPPFTVYACVCVYAGVGGIQYYVDILFLFF